MPITRSSAFFRNFLNESPASVTQQGYLIDRSIATTIIYNSNNAGCVGGI
jgi:hypothetical protein